MVKGFSEGFLKLWNMGFAFIAIQLWSILVDILWGYVGGTEFPVLINLDAGKLQGVACPSPLGCLIAFQASQSLIILSSRSDSFLFSVLIELYLHLPFHHLSLPTWHYNHVCASLIFLICGKHLKVMDHV